MKHDTSVDPFNLKNIHVQAIWVNTFYTLKTCLMSLGHEETASGCASGDAGWKRGDIS